MKRIISFRAWVEDEQQMQPVQEIDFNQNIIGYFGINDQPIENCVLMQFTGLRDKYGKEIYEGDILRVEGIDNEARVTEVVFDGGCFYCQHTPTEFKETVAFHLMFSDNRAIVVGNIYENPELLTAGGQEKINS